MHALCLPWSLADVPGPIIDAGQQCGGLQSASFSSTEDAPTQVTEATFIKARDTMPAHCRVRGYVSPQVEFELQMPVDGWNGKFIELGCGGFCGSIDEVGCNGLLQRGYACIASNMGHRGEDGLWAYNNLQAKVDWGYRGPHVAALAGKSIIHRYYSRAPARSYFSGCSTGGRQAMVEAQRFPWDFDGIIAGAPPLNFTANSLAQLWASRAVLDKRGRSVLSAADARLVHKAVLAQCDLDDRVRDGVLGNPRQCKFDPQLLACKNDANKECLTDEQVAAVKKIYSGPRGSSSVGSGGFMPGSELGWEGLYFDAAGGPGFLYSYVTQKFRYLAFSPDAGPAWAATDFDFDQDYKRLGTMESIYSATNPDLRQFKSNGGKLLMYQGWNDGFEPPSAVVDYYETVERLMGGRANTQDFFRLFMVPGMGHCAGGEGAWAIDYLSYLENWVEHGKAPGKLIGVHLALPNDAAEAQKIMQNLHFPLSSSQIVFSRPIYPYPLRAVSQGMGNPRDAANFVPVFDN
jgi:feruloyl esterase